MYKFCRVFMWVLVFCAVVNLLCFTAVNFMVSLSNIIVAAIFWHLSQQLKEINKYKENK